MSQRFLAALTGACVLGAAALFATERLPAPWRIVDVCLRSLPASSPLRWLHNASDVAIWGAYMSMPVTLVLIRRDRIRAGREVPYGWLMALFAAFIALCGATHALGVVTTWAPLYWGAGYLKVVTGVVSIATAVALVWLRPALVSLPSVVDYRTLTNKLAGNVEQLTTETRRAEDALARESHRAAELEEKLRLIESQRVAIAQLSAPVCEIADRTLMLQLVGIVDSARAAHANETLLSEIDRLGAHTAILDLSGVPVVDTETAHHLLQMIAAVSMLGVAGVVTGIKPHVAQTMVAMSVDLSGVRRYRTLREALRHLHEVQNP